MVLLCISPLYSQPAQDHYLRGIELRDQNKIDEAIKAFYDAIGRNRSFGEAHYEMALLYQSKRTPAALKRAEQILLDANRIDSKNIKYKLALADVYKDRFMPRNARTILDHARKIAPEDPDVLAGLAEYYTQEVNDYKYRVDSVPRVYFYDKNLIAYNNRYRNTMMTEDDLWAMKNISMMPPIRWDIFVAADDSIARSFNSRILEIKPGDRDALYRQGLLYYDKVKYQSSYESEQMYDGYMPDRQYLDEFRDLFLELVDHYPEDKDGQLFLGLAYHRLHEYEKAFEHYVLARDLMSDDERRVFENIGLLKVGGFKETEIYTTENDTTKFWYQRDPLYLSPFNERQLEHYSRVAEANLRYTVPRYNIEGWNTPQGKVLIKYGIPENRVTKKGMPFINDYWQYENFAFVFEKHAGAFGKPFQFAIYDGLNFNKIISDVERAFPEYYKYEPKGMFIDFGYDFATFRGLNGRTRVEVYYGIPVNNLRFKEEEGYYYGNYRIGVFLHDENWNRVMEDIKDNDLRFELSEIDTSSDAVAVNQFTYNIEPDNYHFAIEIQDWYSENVGTFRDELYVEEYGYESLQMSDIQLSWNITFVDPLEKITRDNLDIEPNPRRYFYKEQPIFIYYEIYNLLLNGLPGATDYTIEYSLQYLEDDFPWITDFVRNLVLNDERELGVTTKFINRGSEDEEALFLRVDHNLSKTGPYRLTLTITDNIAAKSVQKSALLRLFENK